MTLYQFTLAVCVPIIITIVGMAFPILLQAISKIDDKYNSSVLVNRFKQEGFYKTFKIILYLSCAYLFYHFLVSKYFPWSCDWGGVNVVMRNSSSLILISATVILLLNLFGLVKLVMIYYDYTKLFDRLYKRADKKRDVPNFKCLSAVASYMVQRAEDSETVRQLYTFLYEYSIVHYKEKEPFDNWFYETIQTLNITLCQLKDSPRSLHNGNEIVSVLLPQTGIEDVVILEQTYINILYALRTQLSYKKTDWVYAYWRTASQYRRFRKEVHEDTVFDENAGGLIVRNKEESEKNKEFNRNFETFHIWLASFILHKKKYKLLEKILSFTQSQPAQYPLVPSSFADICHRFVEINKKFDLNPYAYVNFNFVGNQSVRSSDDTLACVNEFLSLLLYRLNSFEVLSIGLGNNWSYPALPDSLPELDGWLRHIKKLKFFVDRWKKEDEEHKIKDSFNNGGF